MDINGRPENLDQILYAVIAWMDLADKAFIHLAALSGETLELGGSVQQDLQTIIDWLESDDPDAARLNEVVNGLFEIDNSNAESYS